MKTYLVYKRRGKNLEMVGRFKSLVLAYDMMHKLTQEDPGTKYWVSQAGNVHVTKD